MMVPDRSWRIAVSRELSADEGCSRVGRGSEEQHGRVLAFQRTARDETERHLGVWRSHMAR